MINTTLEATASSSGKIWQSFLKTQKCVHCDWLIMLSYHQHHPCLLTPERPLETLTQSWLLLSPGAQHGRLQPTRLSGRPLLDVIFPGLAKFSSATTIVTWTEKVDTIYFHEETISYKKRQRNSLYLIWVLVEMWFFGSCQCYHAGGIRDRSMMAYSLRRLMLNNKV